MAAPTAQSPAIGWRPQLVRLLVSLVIAVAFVRILRSGGLRLVPPAADLARVTPATLGVYVASMIAMQWFRAARWRHLLDPIAKVPLRRVINVSFVGFAAILLMPLRAGEFVRPWMLRERGHVSMAAATGTIGAERVIDGLYLTALLGAFLQIAPTIHPLPDHIGTLPIPVAAVPAYAYFALTLFVGAFVAMALFYWRPRFADRLTHATVGLVSQSLAARIAGFVSTMAEGLSFLPSLRHFGLFFVETTLYWAFNAVGMWWLARGCGIVDITPAQAVVVMGVLGVGILVPAGPGLFGAFQASVFAALAMFFPTDVVLGPGAVFVFFLYVTQFVWHVVSGAVCLALESRDEGGAARASEPA